MDERGEDKPEETAERGDLLVRLYDLPVSDRPLPEGVVVRRVLPPERDIVLGWIGRNFDPLWVAEASVATSSHPLSTWIAVRDGELLGFACHDATQKGFFGPTGVSEAARGQGIGEALLFATLSGMREAGYAYAIIGDPGPVAFYRKRLDALLIPKSTPGIYRGMLRLPDDPAEAG